MMTKSDWLVTAGYIFVSLAPAHGQIGLAGGPTEPLPPEASSMQQAQLKLMEEAVPDLYAFQRKIISIEKKISSIAVRLANKEIARETAKELALPLILEEQKIQNDPEFLLEQKLARAVLSSPAYREKMAKTLRALAQKKTATP